MKNKLWLLKGTEKGDELLYEDKYHGFVIAAPTETEARQLANETVSIDEKGFWLNVELSSCEKINPKGKTRIILSRFIPG